MAVSKELIGLAAEFAVASELCRRNAYAQITFGRRKRTDILLHTSSDQYIRIEVKAKQGHEWPNCKGIYGENIFLVFVDFANRNLDQRADYYVLSVQDWLNVIKMRIKEIRKRNPEKRVEIDSENVPIFIDEVNKYGKPYRGMGISPKIIQEHKEAWDKISNYSTAS